MKRPAMMSRPARLANALGGVLVALAFAVPPAWAGPAAIPRPAGSAVPARAEEGVRWQSLTLGQREALAPLEHEWSSIDAPRKQKWLTIAARLRTLPPPEQARISERMSDWARLTPAERGQVRLRYQEARQVPAPDRSARWEEYQKLPPGEKERFAARAASSAAPPAPVPRRDAPGAVAFPGRDSNQAKSNLVTTPAPVPPRQITPTVVQAPRGATTQLITRQPTPPAHEQPGMPKVAATPEFVNRSTLLPRRGPQAAAVSPVAATNGSIVQTVPPRPAAAKATEPTPPR
jgi:hypothetical protein